MRQGRLGVMGTIVVLELVTAGGLKGGQNRRPVGDLSEAGMIGAVGPSADSRNPSDPSFQRLSSGTGEMGGAAAGVRDQPQERKQSTSRRSSLLIGLYVMQGALQVLDAQATLRALHSSSVREGNPIIRPFASQPVALFTFKLGLGAATIYGTDRLHKFHSRLAIATLGVINAGYVYIVQHNCRCFSAR